jgi:hypothetical protein
MTKSIFIATPMYGGNCSGIFAESLALTFKGLMDLGYTVKYCPLYNESLITRARNILSEVFLRDNSDYLLFIDSDQSFNYLDIHKMILEDKDILGAVVPMKQLNWEVISEAVKMGAPNPQEYSGVFNINIIDNNTLPDLSKPFEVEYIGTGMMLIKKDVMLNLKNSFLKYKNNSGDFYGVKNGDLINEFFTTSIDEKQHLLSEDFNFCKVAKKQNYKIHAVAYPNIVHAGTYFFNGQIK